VKRPGRFTLVLFLGNPSAELRQSCPYNLDGSCAFALGEERIDTIFTKRAAEDAISAANSFFIFGLLLTAGTVQSL